MTSNQTPSEPTKVEAAIVVALYLHSHQTRNDSVLPYAVHPIQVMALLVDIGINSETAMVAALLHDALENGNKDEDGNFEYDEEDIKSDFGEEVLALVKELTFTYTGEDAGRDEAKAAYLASFQKASDEALMIKLVDRVCNTRDFQLTDGDKAFDYWTKANDLIQGFVDRQDALRAKFGDKPVEAVGGFINMIDQQYAKRHALAAFKKMFNLGDDGNPASDFDDVADGPDDDLDDEPDTDDDASDEGAADDVRAELAGK